MPSTEALQSFYDSLQRDAQRLAGGLTDLAQRATVYHHIFEHSGRNHIFPLIAAHGALWARRYFHVGRQLGWWCSLQYAMSPERRRERLAELANFADSFRDINRRVCIETFVSHHFTERFGDHSDANQFVQPSLLFALNRCHAARRRGRELSTNEKCAVFKAFFLNEQDSIVGPAIERATASFQWPLMKFVALRPIIRFAYFRNQRFFFNNFANKDERIEKGLRAFDIASTAGWDRVEASLRDYDILPDAFFAGSAWHFATVREAVLEAA